MKIVAGMGALEEFEDYVTAGADELFCGCVPGEWLERYGVMMPLNRREVLMYPVQIASLTDMKILARMSAQAKVPVAVALNSPCYAPETFPTIVRLAKTLTDMGFERLIVADLALMLCLQKAGVNCKMHLSGEFGEFSRAALTELAFLPIHRLIFHRKVSPAEMTACMGAMPGIEYEAFVLNERCVYTGAMCASLHCDEMPHLCRVAGKIAGVSQVMPEIRERDSVFCPDKLGGSGCGICALDTLRAVGITHLKLVGRGNGRKNMVRDIRALRTALNIPDKEERKSRLFPEGCSGACYYSQSTPEQLP